MDIKEFVADSIRQIINATQELNTEFNASGVKVAGGKATGGINRTTFYSNEEIKVDFNISVTVDETMEKKGGAGLYASPDEDDVRQSEYHINNKYTTL